MSNVFDYLRWRGDLLLSERAFNEVDNLLMSLLSYIDLGGIVPVPGQGEITLAEAAAAYFARRGEPREPLADVVDTAAEWDWMFFLMGAAPRFAGMKLSCYQDVLDTKADKQFCAVSIETEPGRLYLAYRGTTDDLAGWKEDFLLACLPEIPSHEEALRYLTEVADLYPEHRLTLGGHSKGGNLAVYAAVRAEDRIKARIETVWTNDGPGFQQDFVQSPLYASMADRIREIVPKSSMVGLLLNQKQPWLVVDSSQSGVLQHDGITWQVARDRFEALPALTKESMRSAKLIKDWIDSMDLPARRAFVDALFDTLSASGEETVSGIMRDVPKALNASLAEARNLDKDIRDRVVDFIRLMISVWTSMDSGTRLAQTQYVLRQISMRLPLLQAARSSPEKAAEDAAPEA